MPLVLHWEDIALRLALTMVAGSLIGLNRSEGGHAAGLRTTLLVCLAASVAMIQTNLLLPMTGKTSESFAVLDLMRLPLGILTGMGFIGGGAILRKGDMVQGVTTAASLWLVTVIGLCFGGGQLGLGIAATALSLLVLRALKWLEARIPQVRHAQVDAVIEEGGLSIEELYAALVATGFSITSWGIETRRRAGHLRRIVRCGVKWKPGPEGPKAPAAIDQLAQRAGVKALRWKA
ncbi:MgtC/SapB family protein [Aquisphaera insulae]|uniref:MgtC/SapB family protein n=1 Tax=Aquisphaera insulae TaxID=2712864 RepID=UPI0013EB8F02|nr:MgtC/SapB family protein [Aquisphaera insulae]